MGSVRQIATLALFVLLAIGHCRAAGGRHGWIEQPDPQRHAEEYNNFGEVHLPLGPETPNAFERELQLNPNMYGSYQAPYSNQDTYRILHHSSLYPQLNYASYPHDLGAQELLTQDFWQQSEQQQVPQNNDASTSSINELQQAAGKSRDHHQAVVASSPIQDVDNRNEKSEEEEQAPSSEIVYDIIRHSRELLQKEWTRRELSCASYSPEDLAAEIAEVKIMNPGYEWAISKESTRLVEVDLRKTLSDAKERKEYQKQFKRGKDNCRNRVNYIKRQWLLKGTGEELPKEVLLDQFRGAETAQRRRRMQHPKSPTQAVQEERAASAALERATASVIFADFLNHLLGPALSSGRPYSPELIGSLLPLYTTNVYSPEQVQHYMAIYLRQIQGFSEGEVQRVYSAASINRAQSGHSSQQQQQEQPPSGSRNTRGKKSKDRLFH